ncbi:MAG: hypothetical protein KGL37_08225 [Acidobacteriota bacterium]|nr:hypothetical protein [Acidobacteriota bacterium]
MAFELNLLHALHVLSVIVLLAYTFYGFAAAPASKKKVMIITGVATLLVLVTGIRMWQAMFGFAFLGWIVVKLLCWLALSALAGIGYRKRDCSAMMWLILAIAAVALVMVYWKPAL